MGEFTFSELLSLAVRITSLLHEDGPLVIGVRPVWSTILSMLKKNPLDGVVIGIPVAVETDSFLSCLILSEFGLIPELLMVTVFPMEQVVVLDTGSGLTLILLWLVAQTTAPSACLHKGWWACRINSS